MKANEIIIDKGDKDKQGNAVCPQCGRRVLIGTYWGDPMRCPHCDVPYRPIPRKPDYH